MSPQLIVTDLDRTLLNADHDLDAHTIETFQALAECGHHLAIASGRHYRDILPLRERLGVPAHIISTNGAYLHGPDDAVLATQHVPEDLARELIALERPPGMRLNLYRDDDWLIDAPAPELLALHAHTGFGYRVAEPADFDGIGVGKVLFIGEPASLSAIEAAVEARHGAALHLTYSLPGSLEIMAGGVNKGTALARLLERLGLPAEACMAFGDNLNDTEMLDLAGQAFVMANAHPELPGRLPRATRIGHHDDAAVARTLRKHFFD
ncbi:HAD family hydrolase [Onishia niordana]|uniref:HAD family hydrolase n=1 Tax=Onishia niordana TaxID=2508711 RepID=UPI00109F13B0|nr:HAD family hydrolase [Halomonas niordiana]